MLDDMLVGTPVTMGNTQLVKLIAAVNKVISAQVVNVEVYEIYKNDYKIVYEYKSYGTTIYDKDWCRTGAQWQEGKNLGILINLLIREYKLEKLTNESI